MSDVVMHVFLADPSKLQEAAGVLASAFAANGAVINSAANVCTDEDDAANRWVTVTADWDPQAADRVGDDCELDRLCDLVSAAGINRQLSAAGYEVAEIMDESF